MSLNTTALLKNFKKNWFTFTCLIIIFAVVFITFLKVFVLKDFLIQFPEDCESEFNTCVVVEEVDEGELIPTKFLLLKENYFLKNCSDENFDLCLEKCEQDSSCELSIDEDTREASINIGTDDEGTDIGVEDSTTVDSISDDINNNDI